MAVTGATGILGERVVLDMGSPGHEVRQLSHRAPTETVPGVAHYSTDLTTGVGLQRALSGVQVVVDAAHSLASFRRATEVLVGARGVYRQPLRRRVSSIMSCARLWGSRMCRPPLLPGQGRPGADRHRYRDVLQPEGECHRSIARGTAHGAGLTVRCLYLRRPWRAPRSRSRPIDCG